MCGRFALFSSFEVIKKLADSIAKDFEWTANYNVSPGVDIPALLVRDEETLLTKLEWGFIPQYAEQSSKTYKIINAKIETVSEKPTFKKSFAKYRCLIPSNGFYEWHSSDKQPFYIRHRELALSCFAGIYSPNLSSSVSEERETCAIITTEAEAPLQSIHHRMPIVLSLENGIEWLKKKSSNSLDYLVERNENRYLRMHPVSRKVNSVKNNSAVLVEEIEQVQELFP